jgi:uncharacterized protein (DUF2147 family)
VSVIDRPQRNSAAIHISVLVAALLSVAIPPVWAASPDVSGIWMIEDEVAVESYDCGGLLCARIAWLVRPRDAAGQPRRDVKNPDKALRQRTLCGLTVIKGLRRTGPERWEGGSFYDPRDGQTYNLTMTRQSPDVLTGRVYVLLPIFGKSQTMNRVQDVPTTGRC